MTDPQSRTVTSPAGEQIEVFNDDDWISMTGENMNSLRQWRGRGNAIAALWFYGAVESRPSGQAMRMLFENMQKLGYEASIVGVSTMFRNATMELATAREINAKRTFKIALQAMPERWFEILQNSYPQMQPAAEPEPPALVSVPTEPPEWEPMSVVEPLPQTSDLAVQNVATALLNQVVQIISSGSQDVGRARRLENDLADAADRLAKTLHENDRMRKQIRGLGDEVLALREERDSLRKRAQLAEANLQRAVPIETSQFINDAMQREVSKLMQPSNPKESDE